LANALHNRGFVQTALGAFDAAVEDYTHELQLRPDRAVAYYNRGFVRLAMGEYELAIRDLFEAIRRQSDLADAHFLLGDIRRAQGLIDQAIQHYGDALHWNPRFLLARCHRAECYQQVGRVPDAIADLENARQFVPPESHAEFDVALAELRKDIR
jgi:tetratricopeptide (TPR) repeat protein